MDRLKQNMNFFSEEPICQGLSVTEADVTETSPPEPHGLDRPDKAFYDPHHGARLMETEMVLLATNWQPSGKLAIPVSNH